MNAIDMPTKDWLRSMGFVYHAIGKYFYRSTYQDLILVEIKDETVYMRVVADHVDPADYGNCHASITHDTSKEDVLRLLSMMDRGRNSASRESQ